MTLSPRIAYSTARDRLYSKPMKKDKDSEEALRNILAEWRRLPESERQTEAQLTAFAMKMAHDPRYSFQCAGDDPYQHIQAYMSSHTSGLKKSGPDSDLFRKG